MSLLILLASIDDPIDKCRFEDLYLEYHDTLYSFTLARVGDSYDAEDIVQGAFVRIAGHMHELRTDNRVMMKSYTFTVVKNAICDYYKDKNRDSQVISTEDIMNIAADTDIAEEIESNEAYEEIRRLILSIPDTYRDVLYLRLVLNMSYKGIAAVLNKNPHTVKQCIYRGKKMLLEQIRLSNILKDRYE